MINIQKLLENHNKKKDIDKKSNIIRSFTGKYNLKITNYYTNNTEYISGSYNITKSELQKNLSYSILYDANNKIIGNYINNHIYDSPLNFDFNDLNIISKLKIKPSEIMYEIQNPDNNLATFILPSQLNAAKYMNHSNIITNIFSYTYDDTAGSRGQLAIHPGVGQFILDNAANDCYSEGINIFADVYDNMKQLLMDEEQLLNNLYVKNGYLKLPNLSNKNQENIILDALNKSLHKLRIVCMFNVPTCGLESNKLYQSTTKHNVNIIYASGIPVNAYINYPTDNIEFQQKFSNLIITAQYFGALKNAAEQQNNINAKHIIYFMPLGGGVFNNSSKSISNAMLKAIKLFENLYPDYYNKLDIYILVFIKQNCEVINYHNYLKDYI